MMKNAFHVVGHRGFPQKFPENSLIGIVAAAKAGAPYVELDVQISQDGIPIVFHDETLNRACEKPGNVWDYSAAELKQVSCHEPQRFKQQFFHCPIASLQEVCEALSCFDIKIFIEIKEKSLDHISRKNMFRAVMNATQCISSRVILVSFDYDMLPQVKSVMPFAWALREMDAAHLKKAKALKPDILIFDVKRLNKDAQLWPGPWKWFLYDIVDKQEAFFWAGKGVEFIETWDVEALL